MPVMPNVTVILEDGSTLELTNRETETAIYLGEDWFKQEMGRKGKGATSTAGSQEKGSFGGGKTVYYFGEDMKVVGKCTGYEMTKDKAVIHIAGKADIVL